MNPTYIIFDPHHEYGIALIEAAYAHHGLKPVCIYTRRAQSLYMRPAFPLLQDTKRIEANYFLDTTPIEQLAPILKARHNIIGIMPYFEQSIEPAVDLIRRLSLSWNNPNLLQKFRDKQSLKALIAERAPQLKMHASRIVSSAEDVFSQPLPERYVIKPNDGFANRHIGFFTHATRHNELSAYFAASHPQAYVLEPFLEGTEYAVNGQVDALGKVHVISIVEYQRVGKNGIRNLYYRTLHVPRTDLSFAPLATYAANALEATGIKRCPFHMEVMLTPDGPQLVEIGARFGGTQLAFACNEVHGGALDVFEIAAHYYLFDRPYVGRSHADWAVYDTISMVHMDAISEKSERVYDVEGMDTIERDPAFRCWVLQPRLGTMIHKTVDIYTIPFAFRMVSRCSREELVASAERAMKAVRINAHSSLRQRLPVLLRAVYKNLTWRAEVVWEGIKGTLPWRPRLQ